MSRIEEPVAQLPVDSLRPRFVTALQKGPVVVTSPTGSGKSTRIPAWCPRPVLVVEPRRVACRALAQRVAQEEGVALGETVGYQVRDEVCASRATEILFVTPGVALRIADRWSTFATLVVDELHERVLDVDLLLALFELRRRRGDLRVALVAMSATLDGSRVAEYLGGSHLDAEGRVFPVSVQHLDADKILLPEVRGLEERVVQGIDLLCRDREEPERLEDVLVFLPGKGEIARCAHILSRREDLEVLELHGGLSLEHQSRVFRPSKRRKVVLTTNVAETSITVPGVGAVVDSGLVRQTRYHRGRGFLTLVPIALDSAQQRAGRAGRTGPGRCIRLWGAAAQLEARTPPEIRRDSLVPLLLGAAACGEKLADLRFLDPPREHAVQTAEESLARLGALEPDGRITERGRRLFGLPLDLRLGQLLVEAEQQVADSGREALDEMIDLVSMLSVQRPLKLRLPDLDIGEDIELEDACDATHLIRALRLPEPFLQADGRVALREARQTRKRLRELFELEEAPTSSPEVDRRRLAAMILAADPTAAYLPRRRGKRVAWANGGTEVELGRESAVQRLEKIPEALVVLETRALGLGGRETRVLITRALPVPMLWLAEAGLGRERLGEVKIEDDQIFADLERVYARRVLATRREIPRGQLARRALVGLVLGGRAFREILPEGPERLRRLGLAHRLVAKERPEWEGLLPELVGVRDLPEGKDPFGVWLEQQLERLGFESGDELELLAPEDLLPPDLPPLVLQELERRFPSQLTLPGARYDLAYDLARRQVTLHQVTGRKIEIPSAAYLPAFPGLRILLVHKGVTRTLREGR